MTFEYGLELEDWKFAVTVVLYKGKHEINTED